MSLPVCYEFPCSAAGADELIRHITELRERLIQQGFDADRLKVRLSAYGQRVAPYVYGTECLASAVKMPVVVDESLPEEMVAIVSEHDALQPAEA